MISQDAALRLTVLTLAVLNYGTFAWGAFAVFARKGRAGRGLSLIKAGACVSAAVILTAIFRAGTLSPANAYTAIVIYAGTLSLFWWCVRTNRKVPLSLAYSDDTPKHLVQRGPYRFVRHPFYTAYILAYLAAVVATANPWLWLVTVSMAAIYVHAAHVEEAKFTDSNLRSSYARYRTETGMFVPRLLR